MGERRLMLTSGELLALVDAAMGRDFSFDVETTGLAHDDLPLGVSLSFRDDDDLLVSAYVAFTHTRPDPANPTIGVPHEYISRSMAAHVLRPLFAQSDVLAIMHNAKFDLQQLWKLGIEVKCRLYDTMIAQWYLDENLESYGLKQLTARVFGQRMDKFTDLSFYGNYAREEFLAVPLDAAGTYAAADTEWTYKLFEHQYPLLRADDVLKPFWLIGMRLLPVLAEMEWRGIALDLAGLRTLEETYGQRVIDAEESVWREGMDMLLHWLERGVTLPDNYLRTMPALQRAGEEIVEEAGEVRYRGRPVPVIQKSARSHPRIPVFNIGSIDHLGALLYEYYDLKPPTEVRLKKTKKGTVGVDKDTLTCLRYFLGDDAPPVLDRILDWRKAEKLVGTYLKPIQQMVDGEGVLRGHFNQHVARTGRLSSSTPNLN